MQSNKSKQTPKPDHEWSFKATGTSWWIGIYEPLSNEQFDSLQQRVAERVAVFDHTYSRFKHDSWLTSLTQNPGTYALPDDARPLFDLYKKLYEITDGKVTPLIGQLMVDAGYDPQYSLTPKTLRAVPKWEDVMQITDDSLVIKQPVQLDVGAAGKGYLVDLLAEVMENSGVHQYCVDAGGDMRCSGLSEPLRIGLENPDNTEQVIGIVPLLNMALCASAPNRRVWDKYNHIMNPAELDSVHHIKSVWALAETALLADGLTTALFFAPAEKLQEQFEFEYAILHADNKLERSSGFTAKLFT